MKTPKIPMNMNKYTQPLETVISKQWNKNISPFFSKKKHATKWTYAEEKYLYLIKNVALNVTLYTINNMKFII